jgi:hypothetical protein
MLIVWPFDAEGFISGAETYSATVPDNSLGRCSNSSGVPSSLRSGM